MQDNSAAAAANTEKLGGLLSHTQSMVSALIEVGEAMAKATGSIFEISNKTYSLHLS